jgi:hypothetical protein
MISDLEAKIADLRRRLDDKARPDQPLGKEVAKLQKRLRDFAQLAMQSQREDVANSTLAFMAGLERMIGLDPEELVPRRRGSVSEEEEDLE